MSQRVLSEADGCKHAFRCKGCGHLMTSDTAGELEHPSACSVCGKGVVFRHQEYADEMSKLLEQPLTPQSSGRLKELIALVRNCDPGQKRLEPSNWEHLIDAAPERLKQLGLDHAAVVKHVPWKKDTEPDRPPVHHSVGIGETVGAATQPGAVKH